ncbi:MAG: antibiotic biosynthesis monooxygenase [Actinomycetota bacterium]|nr:antibiotic biosynthesis monooxygenase [Actinomycetota bacterium]
MDFEAGQVVTVFRSRLRPDAVDAYGPLAAELLERARQAPGFVDAAAFTAADGERVTVVTFATEETHRAWRDDAVHRRAQELGRRALYAEFSIQVSTCTSARRWAPEGDPGTGDG